MNELLEISMVLSLVLTIAFLIAGTALPFIKTQPFIAPERKVRR